MITLLPKNGATIEMLDWWLRFALDSSTGYLFGESVESLINPKVSTQIFRTLSNTTIGCICRSIRAHPETADTKSPNGTVVEVVSPVIIHGCTNSPQ